MKENKKLNIGITIIIVLIIIGIGIWNLNIPQTLATQTDGGTSAEGNQENASGDVDSSSTEGETEGETEEEEETEEESNNINCLDAINDYISENRVTVMDEITELLDNEEMLTNDILINQTTLILNAYIEELDTTMFFEHLLLKDTTAEANEELNKCNRIVQQEEQMLRVVVDNYIRDKIQTNQTILVIERYQEFNNKLQLLSNESLRLRANFSTFQKKLPCFAKQCLN